MILKRIRENWSASKTYRVLLVAAIVYALLRFAVQVYLFTDALTTQSTAEGAQISSDLELAYIPAARHFQAGQDLYLQGSLEVIEYHFNYAPSFALFFMTVLLLGYSSYCGLCSFIYCMGAYFREKQINTRGSYLGKITAFISGFLCFLG